MKHTFSDGGGEGDGGLWICKILMWPIQEMEM